MLRSLNQREFDQNVKGHALCDDRRRNAGTLKSLMRIKFL